VVCLCCCGIVVIYGVIAYLKYNEAGGSIAKPEAGHETELTSKRSPKIRVGSSRITSAIDSDSSDEGGISTKITKTLTSKEIEERLK